MQVIVDLLESSGVECENDYLIICDVESLDEDWRDTMPDLTVAIDDSEYVVKPA